jgi:hypothetical protein
MGMKECELYKDYKHPAIKFARYMKLVGHPFKIDVIMEWDNKQEKYRMYTDDLKYGDKLEIVYSNDKCCYVIKSLKRIKEEWYKKQGISNDPFDKFMELDDGMQNLQE